MSSRNVVVGLVVAVLAAVLAWWWLGSTDSQAPAASEPAAVPSAHGSGVAGSDSDPSPDARVSVTGRVHSEAGEAIANAVVMLRRHDGDDPGRSVRTDPAGGFELDDVTPGRYAISATAPGFLPAVQRRLDLDTHDPDPIVLQLSTGGHRVYGTISDVMGGPIEGALVRAVPQSGFVALREHESFGTLGDADGAFELFVAPGRYRLEVSHPDYAPQSRGIEVSTGDSQQEFSLVPTASIEGIVRDGPTGPPVAGALVAWSREGMMLLPDGSRHTVPAGGGVVTAGDDGRFRITGVEPGIVVLSARAPARASVEPVEIPVAIAEQVADVELVVAAAHDVRGSVVDARTEEGIADARVQLRGDGPEGTSVLTDAEGNFEIVGVLPGRYTLVAVASGYALAVPGTPLEIADADVDDVQMSLDPGLKIRGRVEPAQLAHVRLDVKPDQMQLGRALFFAASPDGVETDPDGSFELGPVAPGEVTVVAVNADGDAGETAVTIGDTGADEVVVRLQPRARVAGHVRGTDGTPLAQASVTLRPESAPGTDVRLTIDGRDMGTLSAVTTEDGSFEIVGVGEGTHEISIADRYGDEVRIVSGPVERRGPVATLRMTGADRRDLDLQVDAPTGVIDGTVLTDEGEPAPDVWVTLMRRPDPEPAPDADEGGSRHVSRMVIATRGSLGAKRPPVLTGEDGTFRFSGLRDGEYELAAQADGGTSRVTARTRPGRTETLKLAPLGAVEGLASLDGEPIDTFIVAVAGPSSRRKRVRDPGGKFSIDRLDPGHYTLTIRAGSASGDVEVDVEAGRTAKRDVVLQRPATVVGKVTDEGGTPVEGAMVLVGDGSADEGRVQISQDGSDAMIATDDEGKFDFHCAPGARVIVVIEPGQPEPIAVKFFTAEAGARVELGTLTPADKPSRGPPQAVDD